MSSGVMTIYKVTTNNCMIFVKKLKYDNRIHVDKKSIFLANEPYVKNTDII